MSSSYRDELNRWLEQLDVKADRVLDIGGSQKSLKPRVKSWEVGQLRIADLPNPHENSPKPDIELDLNADILDHKIFIDDYEGYDLIFCLEVFEYVWSPRDAMQTISDLLKNGGHAWVTFPSIYPVHEPVKDDALRYMPGGIEKLAQATGLVVDRMIPRRPESRLFESFVSAERMRAAKGVDHHFTGFIVRFKKP